MNTFKLLLFFTIASVTSYVPVGADNFPDSKSAEKAETPFFVAGQDPKPAGQRWVAVPSMSDEFDGQSIDTKKWQLDPVGNGWMWIGRPPGLFNPAAVEVADGMMNVTVRKLPQSKTVGSQQFLYEGAIVRSLKAGQPGWYFETRMKANATEMSSTFWLMTKYDRKENKQKLELDIQECVGTMSDRADSWAKDWDEIFHANMIQRESHLNPKAQRDQRGIKTPTKNHERFYVYACWWKSPDEALFFLDGEYKFTLKPTVTWDVPAYIQMAIETYDWNPVPADGGMVAKGTKEQRTTQYDWVRVWKLN